MQEVPATRALPSVQCDGDSSYADVPGAVGVSLGCRWQGKLFMLATQLHMKKIEPSVSGCSQGYM